MKEKSCFLFSWKMVSAQKYFNHVTFRQIVSSTTDFFDGKIIKSISKNRWIQFLNAFYRSLLHFENTLSFTFSNHFLVVCRTTVHFSDHRFDLNRFIYSTRWYFADFHDGKFEAAIWELMWKKKSFGKTVD